MIILILAASLLINGTVANGTMAAARADAPCTVSTTLVNSCRPWLGASANSYPQTASDMQSQVLYHEQRIGRPLDIVHSYHPTGSNTLSASDVYFATRAQTMLFTDWNPTDTWADIANQNAAIDQMAASIKALGPTRIFMTLWHEPENDVSPGGDSNCPNVRYKGSAGTVADYRNMWRYTTARFTADGVNNVVWVMNYVNIAAFDCLVPDLWPGNNLIDWVMFNAYDNATIGNFASPVSRFIGVLNADNSATDNFASKPWGIAEWGSTATPAQDISFYDSAKASLDNNAFPQLKAYVVYDSDGGSVPATQDLRVAYDANHTADATKASHYYAFADDPALSGAYTPPPPPPDITAPTVSLNAPADGSQVMGSVAVTGTSADDRAVSSVRLLVDGQDSGLTASQPDGSPSVTWDSTTVANGNHTLQLTASDAAGNVGTSATVTVTVANPDTQAPSVPTHLSATPASASEIDLSWTASTDDTGVTGYHVYRDGTQVATVPGGTSGTSAVSWADTGLAEASAHDYAVTAFDAAGNESGPSATVHAMTDDVTAPSAPTGLIATPSDHSVQLSWHPATDNVGVAGYHVYRGATMVATVASGTSYLDPGLADGTAYAYSVTAFDAAGNEGNPSATVHVTTVDSTPPTPPTHLSTTVPGPNEVDLTWTAATDNVGVTGYDVYRDGTLLTTLGQVTSYADTSVSDGVNYTYTVDAFDAAGNVSNVSPSASASTPDVTAPSVPGGLTATSAGGATVNLAWSAATDNVAVAGYNVYRNGVRVATLTGTSYADTGLSDATSYRYTVSAYDAAGNTSAASAAASATTDDTEAPSVPVGVSATASGSAAVNVSWSAATDNVGVAGYTVYRNGVRVATVTGTAYSDTGLSDGTSYGYTVAAFDAAGNVSNQSITATATTADITAPSVPTGVVATATGGTTANVSWSAATDNVGVAGYNVYRNTVKVATVTGTTYADTGLTNGTAYSYTVAAFDAAGNLSNASAAATATTVDTAAPSVPTGVTATATGGTTANVTWSAAGDNVGVAGYNLYRNGVKVATLTGTSYADTGLTSWTSYSYTVSAYDAAGNVSGLSAAAVAKTADITAPSVPAGLKATASGSAAVNLSWSKATDNVGVTGYNVYRNAVKVATVTGTSYADTGLTNGTAYSYTVAAFDAAGNVSAQSVTATATTADTVAPTVPAGLTATASGGTTVNLAWSAATDNVRVVGYNVYRNGVKIATSAGTTYASTGLTNATTYTYTVSAYDAAGNVSGQSTAAIATTADTAAPSIPAKPTVTAPAYNQVTVSWVASTDNVGVAGYQVYRGGVLIATVVGATSYVDATVAAKTAYSYTVSAYDAAGNASKQSVAGPITTPAAPDTSPPSVPTALKSTITSAKAVYLSWTASTDNVGVAGYWVYRNGVFVGTSTKTNYTDSTAVQATTYNYTVSAYDAAGNASAQSAALVVTVPDSTAPTAPSGVTLTPGTKSMTVAWTASTDNVGVVGYYVYRNGVKVATVKTGTSYADKNLTTGTTYAYYVVAFDAANNLSPASTTVSAVPK